MAVKQVSRQGALLQGGSGRRVQPARNNTIQVTAASPQRTVSVGYLQPTVSGRINQQPIYTRQVQQGDNGAAQRAAEQAAAAQAAAAARAEAARIQGVRDNAGRSVGNKYSSYGIKYRDFGNEYERGTRDWATQYIGDQALLNNNQANNALNLRRGMASIASGIRDGIRSGGVTLANMNASTSGAAEAIARAFAKQGNQQFNEVNNEAALERNRMGIEQTNLNQARTDKLYDFDVWGDTTIGNYNEALGQELGAVDQEAQNAGVAGAVDYTQRGQLYNQARQRLDELDARLQQRLAGVGGWSQEQIDAEAARMDTLGMEGYNPFRVNFDSSVTPGNGNGANPGYLPIYTVPRRNEEYYA